MNWIDPIKRKPEGKIFWALTMGRLEIDGERDWEIRRLVNDEQGDYRTLDYSGAFRLPESDNGQSFCVTIFAWLPLDAIPINENNLFGEKK